MSCSPPLALAAAAAVLSPAVLSTQDRAALRPDASFQTAIPAAFVKNHGQWNNAAAFRSRKGSTTTWFVPAGWVVDLRRRKTAAGLGSAPATPSPETVEGVTLPMTFVGASGKPPVGEDKLRGIYNFYVGNPSQWEANVPSFARLRYPSLYAGIDMIVRESQDGLFEYDLFVAPKADLSKISIHCEGIQKLSIDRDGSLVMHTAVGPVIQKAPLTWHVLPSGKRTFVACRYKKLGAQRYGFEVRERISALPLVIDPNLTWSTFLGETRSSSANDDQVFEIVKARGRKGATALVTVCGRTNSPNFRTTGTPYQMNLVGGYDAFVARLDPAQSGLRQLVYATYLGGSGDDQALDVDVDPAGFATTAGWTLSFASTSTAAFPTTSTASAGPFQRRNQGMMDAFVTRLNLTGNAIFSTYLGGRRLDWATGIVVTGSGQAIVTGYTASPGFPTQNPFSATLGGARDAFITQMNLTGSAPLIYSTYLGGSQEEGPPSGATLPTAQPLQMRRLAIDLDGADIVVAGTTRSRDFPTRRALQAVFGGGTNSDIFVTVLNPKNTGATQLLYSTYVGNGLTEAATALDVGPGGVITVGGFTYDRNFRVTNNAFDTSFNGRWDAVLFWLDRSKTPTQQLLYSTFIGGATGEEPFDLEVDPCGVATFGGYCNFSTTQPFPTTAGALRRVMQSHDAYVARIAPRGRGTMDLIYSTYLGGSQAEAVMGVALDDTGGTFLAGSTKSTKFPTTANAYQTATIARSGWVAHLWGLNEGVTHVGTSTPQPCAGNLHMGAIGTPMRGNTTFALYACGAQPRAPGFLALSAQVATPPLKLGGVCVFTRPPVFLFPVKANPLGNLLVPAPISLTLGVSTPAVVQFAFTNTACGFTASNALSIVVPK